MVIPPLTREPRSAELMGPLPANLTFEEYKDLPFPPEAYLGARVMSLEPEFVETLTATAVEACRRAGDSHRKVVLTCAGSVRAPFRALLARKLPLLPVLAYEEVADDYRLEAAGSIAVEKLAAEEARFA